MSEPETIYQYTGLG